MSNPPPLIAHVIYRLGTGGLENGLINLINHMPTESYRHMIICLKDSTEFSSRLTNKNIEIVELNKKEGQDWGSFYSCFKTLKKHKVDIIHTRNLGAIEYQVVAFLAGIQHRVHSEHGWDVFDPEGNNKKYQWLRRLVSPLIKVFIPLSLDLENYLIKKVGISKSKINRICNGVDTEKFLPQSDQAQIQNCPVTLNKQNIYIGTVGRMHGVKDQITLVKAFISLLSNHPELLGNVYLFLIGDGPLKIIAEKLLSEHDLLSSVWLAGERKDIAEIMQTLDVFVLPSQAEGISNTILEAMASGLPVVATSVGGNPELVDEGKTGLLVPPSEPEEMAIALYQLISNPKKIQQFGETSYQRAVSKFSIKAMVSNYQTVYDSLNKEKE